MLAQGRHQAGLTITQVSQRTCIRETIIRGIEGGDFSGCGGDFYARGHIRSIAGVVGVDPAPLIEEYDATLGAPQAISAADVFQPVTPVKLKERRRPNWTAAMALALVLIAGIFAYQHFAAHAEHRREAGRAGCRTRARRPSRRSTRPRRRHQHAPRHCTSRCLRRGTAGSSSQTPSGATLFSGMVYAGNSMNWTERHRVTMSWGTRRACGCSSTAGIRSREGRSAR